MDGPSRFWTAVPASTERNRIQFATRGSDTPGAGRITGLLPFGSTWHVPGTMLARASVCVPISRNLVVCPHLGGRQVEAVFRRVDALLQMSRAPISRARWSFPRNCRVGMCLAMRRPHVQQRRNIIAPHPRSPLHPCPTGCRSRHRLRLQQSWRPGPRLPDEAAANRRQIPQQSLPRLRQLHNPRPSNSPKHSVFLLIATHITF